MAKYLVISYDQDEQQTFYDWAIAKDEEEAKKQIDDIRPYAIAVCAMPPEEMHNMAKILEEATEETIAGELFNIAEESNLLEEDASDPLEFEPDEYKPGWHKTENGLWFGIKKERFPHDVCPECGTPSVPLEKVPDQSLRGCPKCGEEWFEDLTKPPTA